MTYLCTWPACKTAGCIDCNEAVEIQDEDERDDYADEEREPPEFGCCLPPGECCMPGLHFPSECHTAADYEREQFGGWASAAGPRKTPNVGGEARLAAHLPSQTTTATPQGVASTDQLGRVPKREGLSMRQEDLLTRALRIADSSMFALLETETVAHDEFRTVLGLTNEDQQEVASLPEASEAMQEAVAWLMERGYVEMAEDPSGQYVNVLRRPGEDEDEDMEP